MRAQAGRDHRYLGCRDYLGRTALHYAAEHDRDVVAAEYLRRGLDPNPRGQLNETPLCVHSEAARPPPACGPPAAASILLAAFLSVWGALPMTLGALPLAIRHPSGAVTHTRWECELVVATLPLA